MRIIHFSDTHLGITLENTTREEDFYLNFLKVIDDIIELKPDFVIHSGDLFHTPKPSNKAISIAIKGFLKLKENNIKVILIAGNHDTPRLSITTHPFEIFREFENINLFYENKINSINFENINFVVLPHFHDENIFNEEFKKANDIIIENKINIFVSHFGLSAKDYDEYTDEISGVNISMENLSTLKKFDYVALGHYHKNFKIGNIAYSGSIEHTSFNQKNFEVGYNIFDTESKNISTNKLQTRKMIDFGNINCENIETTLDLLDYVEKNIDKTLITGSIVKIFFENINSKLMLEFQDKLINEYFKEAFYFEYKKLREIKTQNNQNKISTSGNILNDNFEDFLKNYELKDEKIKQQILQEINLELKKI